MLDAELYRARAEGESLTLVRISREAAARIERLEADLAEATAQLALLRSAAGDAAAAEEGVVAREREAANSSAARELAAVRLLLLERTQERDEIREQARRA